VLRVGDCVNKYQWGPWR